jgi:hypothetical protein
MVLQYVLTNTVRRCGPYHETEQKASRRVNSFSIPGFVLPGR